jgi:hypothetical protein
MRKQLVALSLVIIVTLLMYSSALTEGYINQYNEVDYVKEITSPTTFLTQNNYVVKLANIEATANISENISRYLSPGTKVYLDILNQTMENNKLILASIVFVNYNNSYYENINEALLKTAYYHFVTNNGDMSVLPYDWNQFITNDSLANNVLRFDLSTFDNQRIALMNTYNNQTVTHAGYLITTIVAILSLFITFLTQSKAKIFSEKHQLICFVAFTIVISLALFIIVRIFFWSWMTSEVLGVTPTQAINQNTTSLISGIQGHLTYYFKHPDPSTYSSLLYYLDQDWPYTLGLSWSIILCLPLSMILSSILVKIVSIKIEWNKGNYQPLSKKWLTQSYASAALTFKELRGRICLSLTSGLICIVVLSSLYAYFIMPLDIFNKSQSSKINNIIVADLVITLFMVSYFSSRFFINRRKDSVFYDN